MLLLEPIAAIESKKKERKKERKKENLISR